MQEHKIKAAYEAGYLQASIHESICEPSPGLFSREIKAFKEGFQDGKRELQRQLNRFFPGSDKTSV